MAELGTAEAFAAHYRAEGNACLRLAFVLCGDRTVAEDIVAEAFAKTWPRYRAGRVVDVHSYVRRAVVNTLNSRFRRSGLEHRHLERMGSEEDTRFDLSPEGGTAERSVLWPALLELPMAQRSVLVLRYMEDQSEQETAAILGVRVGTVKSRTTRGLARLRQLLAEEGGEDA
jgi:RNA polymerase sigma-70 factor (sigma-E family)